CDAMKQAREIRNHWHGHGPVLNAREASRLHDELRDPLAAVLRVLLPTWDRYQLVYPETIRFAGNCFHHVVRRAMGSKTPFESAEFVLKQPLEDRHLHLVAAGAEHALRLFPLVRVIPTPRSEQLACYFFNRIDG